MSEREEGIPFRRPSQPGPDENEEMNRRQAAARHRADFSAPSSGWHGPEPEYDAEEDRWSEDVDFDRDYGQTDPYPWGARSWQRPSRPHRPPIDPWSDRGFQPGATFGDAPFPGGSAPPWAASAPLVDAFVRYGWEMMRLGQSIVTSLQQVLGGVSAAAGARTGYYPRPGRWPSGFGGPAGPEQWNPGLHDFEPSGARPHYPPPSSQEPRYSSSQGITIEVVSHRKCRSSVDLATAVHAGMRATPLESRTNDAPPITAVDLTVTGDRPLVTIEIPEEQPAGDYAGTIHDPRTGRPVGEILVRVD